MSIESIQKGCLSCHKSCIKGKGPRGGDSPSKTLLSSPPPPSPPLGALVPQLSRFSSPGMPIHILRSSRRNLPSRGQTFEENFILSIQSNRIHRDAKWTEPSVCNTGGPSLDRLFVFVRHYCVSIAYTRSQFSLLK